MKKDIREVLRAVAKKRAAEKRKRDLIHRMKTNNPMWDPEVAEKISKAMEGNQNARKYCRESVEDSN